MSSLRRARADLAVGGHSMLHRHCRDKTLAKLANHIAKDAERKPGSYPSDLARICNLTEQPAQRRQQLLHATAAADVWGVGRRIASQLADGGVLSAWELAQLDPSTVRRRWNVTLERTVRELRGQSCIELDVAPAPKQTIACTRSFGRSVTALHQLLEAISEYATRAAEKLREQDGRASQLQVFVHTSPHRPGPRLYRSTIVPMRPTADTRQLVSAAVAGMRSIYEPGYDFVKAGVILLDISGPEVQQVDLPLEEVSIRDQSRLMSAIDSINARFGKGRSMWVVQATLEIQKVGRCAKSGELPDTRRKFQTYPWHAPN